MPRTRQPKFKITWWMRLQARIQRLKSPLGLRSSITRLRHCCSNPYLALLRLFITDLRMPSRNWSYSYLLPEPLAPSRIAQNEALFDQCHPRIFQLRYIPIWRMRDTLLRAVYRLYEIYMTCEFVLLRLECEYIWSRSGRAWSLRSMPDPQDADPLRYAMLASITEELVAAFNWRLKHGLRRNAKRVERTMEVPWPEFEPEVTPTWTASVPAVREGDLDDLPSDMVKDGCLFLEDGESENFARRKIVVPTRYLYTT